MVLLQEITLKYAKVQLFDTKLIRVEVFGNHIIGQTEAMEINDAVSVLGRGRESLMLIVANEVSQFTRQAIEYAVSDAGLRYTTGDALVIKSITQRITANLYLKLNKPKKPGKIFNTEREAVKWLHALEEELVAIW
jgi:hypothetical protein